MNEGKEHQDPSQALNKQQKQSKVGATVTDLLVPSSEPMEKGTVAGWRDIRWVAMTVSSMKKVMAPGTLRKDTD